MNHAICWPNRHERAKLSDISYFCQQDFLQFRSKRKKLKCRFVICCAVAGHNNTLSYFANLKYIDCKSELRRNKSVVITLDAFKNSLLCCRTKKVGRNPNVVLYCHQIEHVTL